MTLYYILLAVVTLGLLAPLIIYCGGFILACLWDLYVYCSTQYVKLMKTVIETVLDWFKED